MGFEENDKKKRKQIDKQEGYLMGFIVLALHTVMTYSKQLQREEQCCAISGNDTD